ncbi:MAG: EAL domain-containing protein [Steroidobacteraceae bacterium]|nr:EAL domain-containing protein [Steroidobacteraceae bacterium]
MQASGLEASLVVGGALGGIAIAFLCARLRRFGSATAAAANHFRAAIEQAPQGVLIADATTLRILSANRAAQRSSGYSLRELRGLRVPQLLTDDTQDPDALVAKLRAADARSLISMRQRCKDGSLLDVDVAANHVTSDAREVLAITMSDVTLRRKIESQLLEKQQHLDHLAHHDQLTGLPNRHYLAAHLPEAIADARRTGSSLAVLFLDLDRFKHINDSRGHEVGDQLLKTVAQRIRSTVRTEDVVVRMGGDEFIVVLKNVKTPKLVNDTAVRINEALAAPVVVDGRPLVTTVSIGVSLYPRDGTDMGELLRRSDTAMYQAKDRGRNNFQLFSPVMDHKLKERIAVEASLRAAIEQQQLDVHYQPIIDIESHRVMGLEALLRWKHPMHGFVAPGRFIRVAEETGLIVPIGEFVLDRVMQDAATWRQMGWSLVPVAVNISAVQLQRSDLPGTIRKLLHRHGLKPGMLQVELTESAVFEHREARSGESSEDAISKLRQLGVRIAIDDFGTGYSSLSYLKRWRVDFVKIDRSFVRDLVTDMSDLAIVGAIIAMARHLNIQVIAEGIEGWQQLEKLRQLHCDQAQGFLFSKPLPAAQCRRFLSEVPLDLTEDELFQSLDATGSYGR